MIPENLAPKRSDINAKLLQVQKNLPPQSRGRRGIQNALRQQLKKDYKNLSNDDLDKIISDLDSYSSFPKRERMTREV